VKMFLSARVHRIVHRPTAARKRPQPSALPNCIEPSLGRPAKARRRAKDHPARFTASCQCELTPCRVRCSTTKYAKHTKVARTNSFRVFRFFRGQKRPRTFSSMGLPGAQSSAPARSECESKSWHPICEPAVTEKSRSRRTP
jgi:hypothetical protein